MRASLKRQSVKFKGERLCKPIFDIDVYNYFELPKNWTFSLDCEYTSNGDSMLRHYMREWTYSATIGKTIGNFELLFWVDNLGLDCGSTVTRRAGNASTSEYEDQDRAGATLQVSYTFNYIRAKYTTKVSGSEHGRMN